MKYAFIVRHRGVWSTRAMCRAMNVSASGFYEWFGRPTSEQSQTDARLTRSIRESFELSDGTYGSPWVWHDLRAAGEHCGINRVARLMKLAEQPLHSDRPLLLVLQRSVRKRTAPPGRCGLQEVGVAGAWLVLLAAACLEINGQASREVVKAELSSL